MTINYSCQIADNKIKPGDHLQENFRWLCGSPRSPAVTEGKKRCRGTKLFMSVKLICQRDTPFPPRHISGINDQALSGAGQKKKNWSDLVIGEEKKKMYCPAQLTNTEFQRNYLPEPGKWYFVITKKIKHWRISRTRALLKSASRNDSGADAW